ncbi:MAG: two-component regulator propeller domain-containing protein [Ferruginibacter sp.]
MFIITKGKSFQHFATKDGLASNIALHIYEDRAGNTWFSTGGGVSWALSRYDAKSLYDKMSTVTEIKSGGPALLGILEANDGSILFGGLELEIGVHRNDGKTITHFMSKEDQK